MKLHTIILFCIALLCLPACTSVSRTDPATGITTKATIALTNAAYVTVDGPVPVVQGYIPTTDKKGRTTGYTPVLGAPAPGAPSALFAAYNLDQASGAKEIRKMITSSIYSVVAGEVLKHMDNNATATDQANVAAQSAKDADAAALAAAKETNRSAEKMAAMEMEAAATTTTATP